MRITSSCALLLVSPMLATTFPGRLEAQRSASAPSARVATSAPKEATQFDFLVGQWELVVKPKVNTLAAKIHGAPKFLGTWKAWRAFDGWGIEDELRIMDGSGNPKSLSHAMRVYDPTAQQWHQTLLDVYRTRFTASNAEWKDNQMTLTASGTSAEGKPELLRTRFFAISPNAFKYSSDRSVDNGAHWDEGVLQIDAKRVAATAPR